MKNVRFVSATLFCVACTSGTFEPIDPGLSPDPDAALVRDPGSISLVVASPNVSSELDTRLSYQATLSSVEGFAGEVNLALKNAPQDWIISYEPASTVSVAEGATVNVSIHIDVSSVSNAGVHEFSVEATNTEVPSKVSILSADLLNVVTLPIADLTGGLEHAYPAKTIRLGTSIRFVNMDTSQPHRIHAGYDDVGFPHQEGNMASPLSMGEEGGEYRVTITEVGTYDKWYCHTHSEVDNSGLIEVIE